MERTIRLKLSYEGTGFSGWQDNPGVRTVQGVLAAALRTLDRAAVLPVQGASRTDAGVHATGQVASFVTRSTIPPQGYLRGLNSLLPPDLAVLSCEETEPGFNARHSARGKRYRYLLLAQPVRNPLLARTTWQLRGPLDTVAMAEGAAELVGAHDFSAFRATGCTAASPVKRLHRVTISVQRGCRLVAIEVVGEAFLKYMVRNIVGTLVQVGLGRRPPVWVGEALASRDRGQAGPTAPASGLTLCQVYYDAGEAERG